VSALSLNIESTNSIIIESTDSVIYKTKHNHHAALNAIACMCQTICVVTSSNVLGRLVQCEQKGWDRGRCVGIHPKGENSMAVSGFGCKDSSHASI